MAFSTVNDLGAVSGATPSGGSVIDPPVRWTPPHDGAYVLKIEQGSIIRWQPYTSSAEALKAVGLEE